MPISYREHFSEKGACVFHRETEWVLAVTHEDVLLFLEETVK